MNKTSGNEIRKHIQRRRTAGKGNVEFNKKCIYGNDFVGNSFKSALRISIRSMRDGAPPLVRVVTKRAPPSNCIIIHYQPEIDNRPLMNSAI